MDSFYLNDQFLVWPSKVWPCKTKVCVSLCVCNKVVYNKIKSASSQVACLDFAQLIQKHSPYGKLIICQMGDPVLQWARGLEPKMHFHSIISHRLSREQKVYKS